LAALARGLHGRARDDALLALVRAYSEEQPQLPRTPLSGAPPRSDAVALALALHTVPHLQVTIPPPEGAVASGVPQLWPRDALERALGLPLWQLDELRDEVDRRVGAVLLQLRAVQWLWSTEGLVDRLLPELGREVVDVVRAGGRICVLVAHGAPAPAAALDLPWLAPALGATPFRSAGVDPGLKVRLARGIGVALEDVDALLIRVVTVIPAEDAAAWLARDRWRSIGVAQTTDLGARSAAGLTAPISDDGLELGSWLTVDGAGEIGVSSSAEQVFHALALPRAAALVRALFGATLAMVEAGVAHDLAVYDVQAHLRAVLAPLHEWVERPQSAVAVAERLQVAPGRVAARMAEVAQVWDTQAAQVWTARTGRSIQARILAEVLGVRQSLQPGPHARLLRLFVGHLLSEARLDPLWAAGSALPAGGGMGAGFWGAFGRLQAATPDPTGTRRA